MYFEMIVFVYNKKSKYAIWFSDKTEGIIADNNRLLLFNSAYEARLLLEERFNDLASEISEHNFDDLLEWSKSDNVDLDCNKLLNYWNIFMDIASSSGYVFLGDKRQKSINELYNKLFCSNNVLIDDEKDKYYPIWNKKEILLMKKIMIDGINMYDKCQ